jgi:hypothetical protein
VKPKPVLAVDLHGTVLDHRLAKFEYFRDALGVPYSHPDRIRREILAELAAMGHGEAFYFAALEQFFLSDFAGRRTLAPGFCDFVAEVKSTVDVVVVTTTRFNSPAAVSAALRAAGCHCELPVIAVDDAKRVSELIRIRAIAYVDDKPDMLPDSRASGILTIQINEARYENRSPAANFFCESWHQVFDSNDVRAALRERAAPIP